MMQTPNIRGMVRNRALHEAVLATIWTASSAAVQWIILVSLSKFLGPASYGSYALAVAVFTPLFRFFSLTLREIIASNFSVDHPTILMFRIRTITSILAGAISFAVIMAIDSAAPTLVLIWTAMRFMEAIYDLTNGIQQRQHKFWILASSGFVRNVLLPCVLAGVLYVTRSGVEAFIVYLVGTCVWFTVYDLRLYLRTIGDSDEAIAKGGMAAFFRLAFKVDFGPGARAILKTAAPLSLAVFVVALNTSVPRYVAQLLFGGRELGILAGLMQFNQVFVPLLVALTQSMLPRLGKSFYEGDFRAFQKAVRVLIAVSFACSLALLGFAFLPVSKRVVTLLLSHEYAEHMDLVRVLALNMVITHYTSVMGPVAMSQLRYMQELRQNLVVLIVLVVACYLLGHEFGLVGIAYGAMCGSIVRATWLRVGFFAASRRKRLELGLAHG